MHITIEAAIDAAALRAAGCVREEVFGKQCYRRLPRLDGYDSTQILTLIARLGYSNEPIATLSVVETTDDAALHRSLELSFPEGVRVARYTQLGVLKAYHGLHLPDQMMAEARRRFVLPNQILYTWLLFNAEHARTSSFCRHLRFRCSDKEFLTEYGRSRVLVRKERADEADIAGQRILENFRPSEWNGISNGTHAPGLYVIPQAVRENEWSAQ